MKQIILDNNLCICYLDNQHNEQGDPIYSYRLIPGMDKIQFLFSNRKGCYVDNKSTLYEDFISLDLKKPQKLLSFLEKYGFVYTFQTTESVVIDYNALYELLKRIKELHNLMIMEKSSNLDYSYSGALKSILFLLTHPIYSLTDLCNGHSENYIYQWYNSIDKAKLLLADPTIINAYVPEFIYNPMNNPNPRYTVENMVTQRKEYLYYNDFVLNEGPKDRNSPSYFLNLFYCCMDRSKFIDAMLADILYYLNKNHKIIIPIINLPPNYFDSDFSKEHNMALKYGLETGKIINYDFDSDLCKKIDSKVNHDKSLNEAIRKLVQNIIVEEYNYLCSKINCKINPIEMKCNIVVPDLLSSLLISISTVLSQDILVRTCVGCGKPFIVPSTNSKKKYHNTACGNRARQKTHRDKEKLTLLS